ncbi:hypothetical protein Patl1_16532 [Pistacia atlantica]|uniref:Uncharacterized protein n=1 Tax=Pistacia atlantica TaxID=434234 RepID=A0ACC1BAP9_9ROSI|nr:hypothetical protein Patl1_16532 [Pistacia atlantica]
MRVMLKALIQHFRAQGPNWLRPKVRTWALSPYYKETPRFFKPKNTDAFKWKQKPPAAAHQGSAATCAATASVQSQFVSATSSPIPPMTTTTTKLMIIHHPHESHHKLNTARLLTKSLRHVTTHLSRKLLPSHITNQSPSPSPSPTTTIYLFPPSPGWPAVSLSELKESINLQGDNRNLLLIVFDATWKHAKEMVKASEGVLEGLGAIRVCLDVDECLKGGSIYDDELVVEERAL